MAFLDAPINADDLPQDAGGFSAIPAGTYTATVTETELKNTKSGTGKYIKLRLDVTGPSHQGRVLFTNINIQNANPQAERIGREQLGSLMRAVGLKQVTDTDQLIGGNIKIKVALKDDDQYGDENGKANEVKRFMAVEGGAQAPSQPAPEQQPEQPAANVPPWQR